MKNLNWLLHAISLAAIIFLFVQNRSLKNSSETKVDATQTPNSVNSASSIAYFRSDTLLSQLGFFKKSEEDMKKKKDRIVNELKAKENNLKSEFERLQASAQNLTRKELEAGQEKLANMERDLLQRRERLDTEFTDEMAEFNEKLHQKVTSYLNELNADKKYNFIFSVERGGNIYYSDPASDITDLMVKGLNEKYSK
ncbi:MAG: OmpH family outer membrane protein [Saprospiraceae bacterium]|nr:OmpH family outer membrane protein [Saprospiraceae bacterium]